MIPWATVPMDPIGTSSCAAVSQGKWPGVNLPGYFCFLSSCSKKQITLFYYVLLFRQKWSFTIWSKLTEKIELAAIEIFGSES